jgi:hypothetical protein
MKQKDIQRIKDISAELNNGLSLLMTDDYAIMHKTSLISMDIFTANYYPTERWAKILSELLNPCEVKDNELSEI